MPVCLATTYFYLALKNQYVDYEKIREIKYNYSITAEIT